MRMSTMKGTLLCLGACALLGHTVSGLHVDAGDGLNVSAPLNVSINSMAAASALAKQYYEHSSSAQWGHTLSNNGAAGASAYAQEQAKTRGKASVAAAGAAADMGMGMGPQIEGLMGMPKNGPMAAIMRQARRRA